MIESSQEPLPIKRSKLSKRPKRKALKALRNNNIGELEDDGGASGAKEAVKGEGGRLGFTAGRAV